MFKEGALCRTLSLGDSYKFGRNPWREDSNKSSPRETIDSITKGANVRCGEILIKAPHWVRSAERRDSLFVIHADRDELGEILDLVGAAYVDNHSMWRFLEWHRDGAFSVTLLVSLDMKYVVVAGLNTLEQIVDFATINVLDLREGNEVLQGRLEDTFIPYLNQKLEREPDLSRVLGYKPRRILGAGNNAQIRKIPKRLNFNNAIVLEFDILGMTLNPRHSLSDAEDFALVWLYLIKDQLASFDKSFDLDHLREEISSRLRQGRGRDENFYSLQGLTFDELDARHSRASSMASQLRAVLSSKRGIEQERALAKILLKVKNADQAAELLVYCCWLSELTGETDILKGLLWDEHCRHVAKESPSGYFDWENF